MTDDNKSYISGTYRGLLRMLEDAFEAGFDAGYHSEDNPACYEEDWDAYHKAAAAAWAAADVALTAAKDDAHETLNAAHDAFRAADAAYVAYHDALEEQEKTDD